MEQIISLIQETVQDDAAQGKVLDVDSYCAQFANKRPDLDVREIREVVEDAIASFGLGGYPGDDRHAGP